MIAKNKGDFLYNLHNELHRIGIDDDEEIFADFEAHFKESAEAGVSEEETCEKLGDVKEIARSYLDIPSTRINSIVVDAIANNRVSLTKPGKTLPADLSLVKDDNAGEHAGQPAVREFTPEHIMEEPTAPAPSVPKTDLSKSAPVREFTPEHIAYEPEAPSRQNSQGAQGAQNSAHPREFTPQHTAQEQPSQQASADTRYQYGVPKQTDDMHANSTQSRVGEVPPQCVPPVGDNAKTGGFRFSDVRGMKPNVNAGRLVGCILMDVLLWSWLIPMVVSLIFSVFVGGAFSLVTGAFTQLGNEYFNFISRIFLCCGMASGGVLLGCAAFGLCRAVFHWIKSIVVSHVRAVYDI